MKYKYHSNLNKDTILHKLEKSVAKKCFLSEWMLFISIYPAHSFL